MTEQHPEGLVDLNEQHQWEAGPDEELKIPEVFITQLKYEVVVFAERKSFTFRCSRYKKRLRGEWNFENVIIDSSKQNPQGEVELKRLTYHPKLSLANVPFMVLPAAEDEPATP